jgi:hypothetical protein
VPKVIIDVSNVPDSDRATYDGPVPRKGLYKALFKKAWWTKTNDKSKTMLKVLFILDTDNEAKKQFNGYAVWHNVTYEPSTQWKMKELFVALRAGDKAAVDYDDKGDVSRIGRAMPGKVHVLIHGEEAMYKGKAKLEVGSLAPVPKPEGEEDEGEEWGDEGEATAFDDAGGVAADEAASSDGEYASSTSGEADPWASPAGDSEEAPF